MKRTLFLLTLYWVIIGLCSTTPVSLAAPPPQTTQGGRCSELQVVFLVDQSGSMSDAQAPSDPNGLRYLGPQRAIEVLSTLRYQSYTDSKMQVSVVNFGTQPATALDWFELDATNQAQHQQLQQALAPAFFAANLGFTNHRAAFENASALFAVIEDPGRIPTPGDLCPTRAVIMLTDGAPQLTFNDPSDFHATHLNDLSRYVRQFMPLPQYQIYVIGVDTTNNYWSTVRPFWEQIAGDPSRVVRVTTPEEMSAYVLSIAEDLTRSLALGTGGAVPTTACITDGRLVVPPFVQELRLTLIKPRDDITLQVEDAPGRLLVPSRTDVVVELQGRNEPIETLIVRQPQPGIWNVLTQLPPPPTPDACQIRMFAFSAAVQASTPAPADTVQFKQLPLSLKIADGSGTSLPNYGSQYPLEVEARLVSATEPISVIVDLEREPDYTYSGKLTPLSAGPHRLEVRAASRDPEGNSVMVMDFKPVANLDIAPVNLELHGFTTTRLPQHGTTPISLTLTTPQGPVRLDLPFELTANLGLPGGSSVALLPQDLGNGIYQIDLIPDQVGIYRFSYRGTVATPSGEVELGTGTLDFEVFPTTRINAQLVTPTGGSFVATDWRLQPTGLTLDVQLVDEAGNQVSPGAIRAADQQQVLRATVLDTQQRVVLDNVILEGLGRPGLFRLDAANLGRGTYTVIIEPLAPLGEGFVWSNPNWSHSLAGRISPLFFAAVAGGLLLIASVIGMGLGIRRRRRCPLSGFIRIYQDLPTSDGDTYQKEIYKAQLPGRNKVVLTPSGGLIGWLERLLRMPLGRGRMLPFKLIVVRCRNEDDAKAKRAHLEITLTNGKPLSITLGPDTPPRSLPDGSMLEKGPRSPIISGVGGYASIPDDFPTTNRL
ncbi:VWA domain-containing protein [Candidatus Chloroploca sp. M-50]|uniref:VWA domain-containing protein n=1 Tax=Candidatus Chloroploca mongolica TaxID=2528176 RepID=A0ABS4D4U2_9CHLR|nr:vWA domain-containing protein [Candidatus Chloroploca mongolica]MBP1464450.1 VWA domain-containing protein [Candidatus Chloroploca mongolica]